MKEKIAKFREYLDYVERHYDNVQKAWKVIQEKCKDMSFIRDESTFWALNYDIENHDISKLDKEEFFAYRSQFYPTKLEIPNKEEFEEAWMHHLENNDHHWQNWTNQYKGESAVTEICLVHNIIQIIVINLYTRINNVSANSTNNRQLNRNHRTIIPINQNLNIHNIIFISP